MIYVDLPFYFAVAAIGFGLSLMTYRLFARHYAWPMGAWHESHPSLPFIIGLISFLVGALFAAARGLDGGIYAASAIGLFGLSLAILWTSFFRVGSQLSLFLAPVFAGLLFVSWNFGTSALQYHTVRSEIRELRQQIEEQFGLKKGDATPRKNSLN
jgi:energy-coupling factor transporter transmembrane protein EcfT